MSQLKQLRKVDGFKRSQTLVSAGCCDMRDMLHSICCESSGAGLSASSSSALTKTLAGRHLEDFTDCSGHSREQHYPDEHFHLLDILWGMSNCCSGLVLRWFKLSPVNFYMAFLVYTSSLHLLMKSLKADLEKKQRKKIYLCIVFLFYLKSLYHIVQELVQRQSVRSFFVWPCSLTAA